MMVFLSLLFVAVTNRWLGWREGIVFVQAADVNSYEAMAIAAPGLPLGQGIPFHHAQRLLIHYVVGTAASVLGISHEVVYRFVVAFLAGVFLLLMRRLFSRLVSSVALRQLCLSALIFSPYLFRYYAIVPGMAQDLLFFVGLAGMMLGLVEKRGLWVCAGLALAYCGRQTIAFAFPGVLFWLWSERRRGELFAATATLLSVHFLTGWVVRQFSTVVISGTEIALGLVTWIRTRFSLRPFLELVVRTVLPVVVPTALALPALARFTHLSRMDARFWALLFMALGLMAQPVLAGPFTTGQNASRLGATALPCLVAALALALGRAGARLEQALSPNAVWACWLALCVASFHHLFSWIGPPNSVVYLTVQLVVAGVMGGCFFVCLQQSQEKRR